MSRQIRIRQKNRPFSRRRITANDDKFRELVLYIAGLSENDPAFGLTKLNKLLFFSDFIAYARHGKPITGQEYQALENGPAPRRAKPLLSRMRAERAADVKIVDFHGREQHRVKPLREALVGAFTSEEVALVSRLVNTWWGKTAEEISDFSHLFVGWKMLRIGDIIPYSVALIGGRKPTKEERERGLRLEALARQCLADVARQT